MHYRFLVTFDTHRATTSTEAREYVWQTLNEEGFCEQGRWAGGLCDWFVIGGRWSGELSRHSWARALTAQMLAIEQEHGIHVWGVSYGDKGKQHLQAELAERFHAMWKTVAPPAYQDIPIQRNTYGNGYEDDAMLLTQELYDALLKEHEGATESEYHADLDSDEVSPAVIGAKWIVVVDYHN